MEHTITKDVFVVSDNIISALGFTTAENIRSITEHKTGIVTVNKPGIYPEPFPAAEVNSERLQQLITGYRLTDYNLTEAAGILSILLTLEKIELDLSGEENLLILSTTKGNIAGLSGQFPPEANTFPGYTANRIAAYFKMKNKPVVVSNACVSGVTAITTATRLLETNRYKNCIVLGLDFVTAFTVSGFQSFKSISPKPCKPYDKDRDGLSIGEATGSILLTNNPLLIAGKKEIRILGGATSNDANHISGPSRTGDGLSFAIENALKYSGVAHEAVDFINLHGTATGYNDEMESKALKLSGFSELPVNSLKGYWGHTLGASGVIETIVSIESLRRQTLFATLGFETLGTPEPLNVIPEHQKAELHTFIKTASGFGGFNSAVVITDKPRSLEKIKNVSPVFSNVVCTVQNNQIKKNGRVVFETSANATFQEFIKSAYKNLDLNYPKFYKMDDLCKSAFITFEYLVKDIPDFESLDKKKTALVFGNTTSSLDTDLKHQQSINDPSNYFPSPAVFVYTLPNIMLGEIAIRHKIQGETICFIGERTKPEDLKEYIQLLLETTDTEFIVFGKVDYLNGEYSACLSFAQR
ncbi:MAG: beta-ACP synthase [Dysgonamonadaceae bacterium]|nr:beta-ACP synthase [Dysgonamonadaceae bacterium]